MTESGLMFECLTKAENGLENYSSQINDKEMEHKGLSWEPATQWGISYIFTGNFMRKTQKRFLWKNSDPSLCQLLKIKP